MTSVLDALAFLQAQARRGAYGNAATYSGALPQAVRAVPAIALERARAYMRQGRMSDATRALAEADLEDTSVGERLVIALEAASLRIYRDVAIRAALDDVDAAFAVVNVAALDPGDRAEAERIRSRVLLIAAVYYEVDAETARQARDRLPTLAQTLEGAGRLDVALAAELTYAERIDDPVERATALAALAQRAEQLGRPGLAGEAQVSRADLLLSNGAASDEIVVCLDAATTLFITADHAHGHIDVQRVKARLAVERELASPELLELCFNAYNDADYPRGALSVLMDLLQLAHQRGDTAAAARYRRQSLTLAEEIGMGLARDNFQLAQADLLMRNGDYGAAIELCQAALATECSPFLAASFEQLLASIYSFVNDNPAALRHGRNAMHAYESIGAIDLASDAVLKLASDLGSERHDDIWNEAEALLDDWLVRDEQRGDIDAAISKHELLVQTAINRFVASPQHRGDVALLAQLINSTSLRFLNSR